jgi:hypothetical protein
MAALTVRMRCVVEWSNALFGRGSLPDGVCLESSVRCLRSLSQMLVLLQPFQERVWLNPTGFLLFS